MKFALTAFALLFTASLFAQLNPVKWTYSAVKTSDDHYDITFTATIEKGWYIYSQYLESEDGPIATSFTFNKNQAVEKLGKSTEDGHKKEGFDSMFSMNIVKYSDEVKFVQPIHTKGTVASVKGFLTYMTCDGEKCLPPKDVDFDIPLPK